MTPVPKNLSRPDPTRLRIEWSDGENREYTIRELRDACPCATCREKRNAPPKPFQLTVLSEGETKPLALDAMKPVGNYAYAMHFSDGHDTGIYTLDFLRELGKPV